MNCIVVSYPVLLFHIILSCLVVWHGVVPHLIPSSYRFVSRAVLLLCFALSHVLSHPIVADRIVLYRTLLCRIVFRLVLLCPFLLYHVVYLFVLLGFVSHPNPTEQDTGRDGVGSFYDQF